MNPREKHVQRQKAREKLKQMKRRLDKASELDEDNPYRLRLEAEVDNLYKELRYGVLDS